MLSSSVFGYSGGDEPYFGSGHTLQGGAGDPARPIPTWNSRVVRPSYSIIYQNVPRLASQRPACSSPAAVTVTVLREVLGGLSGVSAQQACAERKFHQAAKGYFRDEAGCARVQEDCLLVRVTCSRDRSFCVHFSMSLPWAVLLGIHCTDLT